MSIRANASFIRICIAAPTNRVAYPFASFAKGWGIARSASVLLLFGATSLLSAQSAACGLASVSETSQLVYPAIARAAQVSGTVILLARFETTGTTANIRVVSGPPMLQDAAVKFVKSWRANDYSGPRDCPIVVSFNVINTGEPVCSYEEAGPPKFTRSDTQHVSVAVHSVSFCDPAVTIGKKHRRWF